MEMANISPDRVTLFGNFTVPVTMITLWAVSAVIIVLSIVFKFVIFPRFTAKPKNLQNVIELGIEAGNKMALSNMSSMGKSISSYVAVLAITGVMSGVVGLLGVRAPGTGINFTAALALITFVLINIYAIKKKGLWGRMKWFGEPVKFIAPIKLLTQLSTPISLACRMFGNLFSGLVIMDLVYQAMGNFAIAVPGILAIYFNLFHIAMQSYVFVALTMAFINEGIE